MEDEMNQQRIEGMYRMLLEMADGNFNYELPTTGREDTLESLLVLLNMLAKELRVSLSHWGYIDPHKIYHYLQQVAFILDKGLTIESFSAHTPLLLGYSAPSLHNRNLRGLLSSPSVAVLEETLENLYREAEYSTTLELVFITSDDLTMPCYCTLSRLLYDTKILVSSVCIILQDSAAAIPSAGPATGQVPGRSEDVKSIQAIYDYVLNNLENPLPTGKVLARKFGINELKLKLGFKEFFNTSVYKLYNSERLKKAHLLIKDSTLPLQEISDISGFTSYANFSKAFRKAYGYAPRDLRVKE